MTAPTPIIKGDSYQRPRHRRNVPRGHTFVTTHRMLACPICQGQHGIRDCEVFKAQSASKRLDIAKRAALCTNCLGKGHSHKQCSAGSCRICKQRHNTYLHRNKAHSRQRASNGRSSNSRSSSSHSSNSWSSNSRSSSGRSPSDRSSNGQSPSGSPAPRSSHHSRRPTEHSRIPIPSSSKEKKHSPKRESRQSRNTSLGSMHLSHRPILNKRHNDCVKR